VAPQAQAKTQPVANSVVYECRMTSGRQNFIPPNMFFGRDLKTNEIKVWDSLIHDVSSTPVVATVLVDTPQRLQIGWALRNLESKGRGTINATFSLLFLKTTGVAVESVRVGASQTETRDGTCALAK
jgi:hypothetical protein